MATEEEVTNLKTTHEFLRLWNEDPDRGLKDCYDEANFEGLDVFTGKTFTLDEVRAAEEAMMQAIPDRKAEVHRILASGDAVVIEASTTGHWTGPFLGHEPDGRSCKLTHCTIFTFRDGKIIRDCTYSDVWNLMRQLGIDPTVATPYSDAVS
jgi:steroid delta-isomerase-like uncharacterized protein